MTQQEILEQVKRALRLAENALSRCYDVTEWPANGTSTQDAALQTAREALALLNQMPEQEKGWFIPASNMSSLAKETFANMLETINHYGQVDVVARVDGRDYRWECDGLKYARPVIAPSLTPAQRDELVEEMAEAIRGADNGLDGDPIAVLLDEAPQIDLATNTRNEANEFIMTVCRSAARAALAIAERKLVGGV